MPTGGQRPLPDSLHCQPVQKGSGAGPEPLLLFPGLPPQLSQQHLPVIQDTEAKSEQAKWDWKCHQRVCAIVSRMWEVERPICQIFIAPFSGKSSLCTPAPKARLWSTDAEFLTAWAICDTENSQQLPPRFIPVFTKAGPARACSDLQGGSTNSMSFI